MRLSCRRFGSVLTILAIGALCTSLQHAPLVSAKDKPNAEGASGAGDDADSKAAANSQSAKSSAAKAKTSAKSKARPETAKKKKGAAEETADSNQGSTGNSSGSGSVPSLPGGTGGGSNAGSKPADYNVQGNQPAAAGAKQQSAGAAGKKGGAGGKGVAGGGGGNQPAAANQGPDPEVVKKVMDVQNRATPGLISQKGVVGTATGLDEDGNVVIRVYTTGADSPKIPKTLENIPVVEVLTGPIHALYQAPPFNQRARQARPVPIGVSGGSENGACVLGGAYSGTIGCRLKAKDGTVYGLSNNHVFASENAGIIGDLIVQPATGDEFLNGGMLCDPNDIIGTLFQFKPIVPVGAPGNQNNLMDAAIMLTDTSQLSNATPASPVAYGPPRTITVKQPFLGMSVQKLGRTSAHTTGYISALNKTVVVGYTAFSAMFVNQIEITANNLPSFGIPGDSGSLIVTDDRFPVALLFAGGGGLTDANPIQPVLDEFGLTIDGDSSAYQPPGKAGRSGPNSP